MRPKGLIGLGVVVLIVGLLFYVLSDDFIEHQLEDAGESLVGAKVEIDHLHFSLLGLEISWDGLQVANPNDTWENLFQTGSTAFDMDVVPLARKKININLIQLTDVRVGTKRATDGALPPKAEKHEPGMVDDAAASLKKQVSSAPVLNLGILKKKVNVDSLMKLVDIQSVRKIAGLEKLAETTKQKWKTSLKEFDPQNDLVKAEKQIDELKTQDLKGLDNLLSAAKKSKNIYDTLNGLKKDIEQRKKQFFTDFSILHNNYKMIDNWVKIDINAIKSKANLGEFTKQSMGTMLFGQKLTLPLVGWLKYIDTARKYMPVARQFASAGKVENPPRMQGQDIRFPITTHDPNFLIEQIRLSAASNHEDTSQVISVSGDIKGITSDQKIYGRPLTFALKAGLPNSRDYTASGKIDHTGKIPEEEFTIKAANVPIGNISLPPRTYLPSRINIRKGDLSAAFNLVGNNVNFNFVLNAKPVQFFIPDSLKRNDVISGVTESVFHSIDLLQLAAKVSGPVNDLSLSIHSNIDKILAERISGIIGESLKSARAEINRRVNSLVGPKKLQAEALIKNTEQNVTSKLNELESRINRELDEVKAKKAELDQKVKAEKEKAKAGVKKKLKNLFKKN